MNGTFEITLVENFTGGNQPKTFAAQAVDIAHVPDTVVQSVDGRRSAGGYPSKILWHGGTARELANTTNVKIVGKNGAVIVDDELNVTYGVPRDVAQGVEFFVLNSD